MSLPDNMHLSMEVGLTLAEEVEEYIAEFGEMLTLQQIATFMEEINVKLHGRHRDYGVYYRLPDGSLLDFRLMAVDFIPRRR